MYLEFLLRRAHSRRRVERRYWSGVSLYSRTTCSNSVMVGTIGPIGSGLPQLGFPRRFAMKLAFPTNGGMNSLNTAMCLILRLVEGCRENANSARLANLAARELPKLNRRLSRVGQFLAKVNRNLSSLL